MNNLGRPTPETIRSPGSLTKDDRKAQRRTPWACDECRLRKRKCDGVEPCTPCQRSALDCSYHFRRPAPPQTQRIQMLEIHLRYVRSFLQDASRKVPPELGIDFEGVLQKINSVALDPNASPSTRPVTPGTSSNKTPRDEVVAKSHPSFLQSVIEELEGNPAGRGQDIGLIDNVFNLPMKETQKTATTLPSHREALRLIDALFDTQHPMLAFLHEQYFRETVDMVYTAASQDDAIDRFLPMLHIALGLGYLFCRTCHGELGCHAAQKKATQHYLTGRNMLQPLSLNTMTALQALLCAIVWLLSTCRIVQAHPLVGLAVSLAMRLGLHAKSIALSGEERQLRTRVLAAVVHVDLYTSLLLGIPPFLEHADIHVSSFDELSANATAARDVKTSVALGHLSLLIVCQREHRQQEVTEPEHHIRSHETQAEELREKLRTFIQQLDGDERGARAQYQLEMLYNFAFLHLWRDSFLKILESSTNGGDIDHGSDNVRLVSACLKVAIKSVTRSEEAIRKQLFEPSSWPVMYTLLLSVVYMVSIAASHEELVPFGQIQAQIVSALHLLALCKCGNGPGIQALQILKAVMTASGFDHIGVDEIASNTKTICAGAGLPAEGHVASSSTPDDIMALLNTHRQDASSTTSMSRSPSTTTTADEVSFRTL